MKSILAILAVAFSLGLAAVSPSWSAPIDGKLSLETPIKADRASDSSSMILGSLSTHLAKRLTLTGTAQWNLGNLDSLRSQCLSEDKVKALLSYDLRSDLVVYSYFESRYSLGQDRVVMGASYKFRVR